MESSPCPVLGEPLAELLLHLGLVAVVEPDGEEAEDVLLQHVRPATPPEEVGVHGGGMGLPPNRKQSFLRTGTQKTREMGRGCIGRGCSPPTGGACHLWTTSSGQETLNPGRTGLLEKKLPDILYMLFLVGLTNLGIEIHDVHKGGTSGQLGVEAHCHPAGESRGNGSLSREVIKGHKKFGR